MMKFSGRTSRRQAAGYCLLAGLAVTTIAAPTAFAAPDCSAAGVTGTVSSVTGSANQYLGSHPGANAVVGRAQSVGKAVFVFPGQGSQWVGMGQCNTTVLSPELESAYNEFMAG